MAQELLDLSKIRRNWDRTEAPSLEGAPDRLGHVRTPLDPYLLGAQLLERLRLELADEFPAQRELLAPFIARVDALFERMREQPGRKADSGAPEPQLEAAPPMRERFVSALNDLEDLCEALLGLPR